MSACSLSFGLFLLLASFARSTSANTCAPPEKALEPTGPKRWAVVALTKPGRSDTAMRNSALVKALQPYANKHDITFIFFSEHTFDSALSSELTNQFKSIRAKVEFINTASRGFSQKERFGYKYMCKFFAVDIFDYLRQRFDYYMRCDTDCYIKTMGYDLLQFVEENKVGYGFALRKLEAHKPTRETLTPWVDKYIGSCGIVPSAPMDRPLSACFNFYNNWHVGDVSFFTRRDVAHFLSAVNASGNILTHRWGDSTVQAYAVRLFMDPASIVQVPNFTYIHGSHSNRLVTTFNEGRSTDIPQKLPFLLFRKSV